MKNKLFLIPAIVLLVGCSSKPSPNEQAEANPITVSLKSSVKTTVSCKSNGKAYSADYTRDLVFINDSTTSFIDSSLQEISIVISGFEKPLYDTLNVENLKRFLMDSLPNFKDTKLGSIGLKGISVNPELSMAILKLQVDFTDYNHVVDYELQVDDSVIADRKFHYITTRENKKVTSSSISLKVK